MPAVHMHNFESISAAEEIIHIKPVYIYRQMYVHRTESHINKMKVMHTYFIALKVVQ